MPARLTSLIALGLLLCALLAPADALAQSSPFGPIPQPAPEPVPTVVSQNDNDEDDGLNGTQELLIAAAGLVLLVGIGWAIVRDARQNAPTGDRDTGPLVASGLGEEGHHRGTRAPKQQRVKTNRQKAKSARKARKRNR